MKVPRKKSSDHTVTGDAREAWHLILNAAAVGIGVTSVSVGSCRVELREPRPAQRATDEPETPRDAIYAQFGGDMYRRMTTGGKRAAGQTVSGEEYQPAIESDGDA